MENVTLPVRLVQHQDAALLDAYSRTVTSVVASVAEAVVSGRAI